MGGGGSSNSNGGSVEAPNNLISDSLIALTHVIGEGPIKGFGTTSIGYYNNSSGAYSWDPLTAVFFNDVVVRNGDGSYNFNVSGQGFQFSWTYGTNTQLPMSGFEIPENIIPLINDTLISNPLPNAGLPKIITVTFNTTEYPDADSVKITVRIPELLTTDTHGNINGFQVSYGVDISTNGGPFITVDNQTINGKCTTPYFYTTQYTLPKPLVSNNQSYYQWTIRVYKTSNDVDSAMTADNIYVDTIAIVAASQYSYPNTALAGVYIDALQFGSIPSVAYLINGSLISVPSGMSPTAYGITGAAASNPGVVSNISHGNVSGATYPNVWYGTMQTGVWTDNPAWIYNDLLTNTRYGLGRYLQDEPVDIWSLYEISQFCDQLVPDGYGGMEPQFTCNVNIKDPDDAYNVLLNLASTFRGMLYYANGTIQPVQTDIQSNSIYTYSNANVINAEFNYSSTARNTRHTAAIVKYTDPLNLYRDNFVYVEDTQGIIQYGYNPKTISAFACTSPGQATRLGNWTLTTERLRTDTVSFQVGFDGLYVKPGDVFAVYDNFRNNKSQGGRILSYSSDYKTIELDRQVVLNSGMIYALSILSPTFDFWGYTGITGSDQIPEIRNEMAETQIVLTVDNPVNGSGGSVPTTNILQVSGAFSTGIQKNALWLLSVSGIYNTSVTPTVFDQVTLYQCINVSESQPGIADVIGLQYNTGISYIVNTGFTAVAIPPATGDTSVPAAPTNFTGQITSGQLSNYNYYEYLNLTWSASSSTNASFYVISGLEFGASSWTQLEKTNGTGMTFATATTGKSQFLCATVSKGGIYSAFQSFNYTFNPVPLVDPTQIRFWELPQAFGDLYQIAVLYNRPDPATISTRVFYSPSGNSLPFTEALDQSFYCAKGTITNALSATGTLVSFTSSSYDMQRMQSQTTMDQNDGALLLLVDDELISIGSIAPLGSNNYNLTGVLRGQMGTFPTVHGAYSTGWMFYQSELTAFNNNDLYNIYANKLYNSQIATKYFQIQNTTLNVDGTISPPAPGLSYTLPNPAPNPPTSLTAINPGGPIVHLLWVESSSNDVLQYQVFKATSPFTTFSGIGATTNLFFDDVNVLVGNTYQYYVTTEASNEEQSTSSNTVTVIPTGFVPSGFSVATPNDPNVANLASSGNYLGADGTLYAFLSFNLPAMATGAQYQNILYTKFGGILAQGTTASQISNTITTGVTIYDLSPNVQYSVGTQSVSNFGLFSQDVVAANGSPFLTPSTGATAGNPGGPPLTPTNLQGSGGLGNTANFVALSWTANSEKNLEEYGIYRNGTNSAPATPLAFVGANTYVDASVTGGSTYYYWVSAYNRSEQQSSLSSSVGPFVVQGAPASPTAPVLSNSGYYMSADGNVLNDFTFTIAALPAYAFGQEVLYGTTNNTAQMLVGNDLENASSSSAVLNDLTPGTSYYVAVKAYSQHGVPSAIVFGNGGNPYVAPGKSPFVNVVAPTNVQFGLAQYQQNPMAAPKYSSLDPSSLMAAMTGSWILSTDSDIAFYEYYCNVGLYPPSNSQGVNDQNTVPASINNVIVYLLPDAETRYIWVRAQNKSQLLSTWTQSVAGEPTIVSNYAGDMGAQSSSATQISQLQVGPIAISSVTKQLVHAEIETYTIGGITTLTPGAVNNSISASGSLDISAYGFNTKPDVGTISVDDYLYGTWGIYSQSLSSSTNAVIQFFRTSGSIINGYHFNTNAIFTEYA